LASVHEFTETSVSTVLGAAIIIAVPGTIYLIYRNWVQMLTLEVYEKERNLGEKTMSFILDKTGDYVTGGIIRRPFADIFMAFQGLDLKDSPPVIPVHVTIYPLINIFWLGDILLSLGIILLMWKKK
jgi:hypothetical protein